MQKCTTKRNPSRTGWKKFIVSHASILVILTAGVVLSSGCSILSSLDAREILWPTEGWAISSPEEQGMDSAPLERMMELIDENQVPIDSVIVVRNGRIVFEEYRNGYDEISSHMLQSVTKSFTSTLIGIAMHQGSIESVDQLLLDFYPDRTPDNPDPRKGQITLEHLLTMSPGMDWHEIDYPYTDPRNSLGQMWLSDDVVQHVLDHPMIRDPGEAWSYNSGTSILLGDIVEVASGIDTVSFARWNLFDPLGFGSTYLAMTNDGHHYHTDGGLFMIPRDMARLGYLMLHDGVWEGERLLPEGWVQQATTAQYQAFPNHGYAYQWWTIEGTGIYYASGHYDQAIYVIPEADMVVVFTANVPDEAIHPLEGFLFRYILSACTDLPDGYLNRQYANYGFSFPYDYDFSYTEEPFPGTDGFSSRAGVVQFSYIGYPIELFTVMWNDAFAGMSSDGILEVTSSYLAEDPGLTVTPRESVRVAVGSRDIRADVLDVETEGLLLTASLAVWTCDSSDQSFVISFVTDHADELENLTSRFAELLGSFSCLEPE